MIHIDIVVRFTAEGWHCWPNAPEARAYLRASHRHLLYVEVQMQVLHNQREVEFHDLLDFAKKAFGHGDFGAASCETLATRLLDQICMMYSDRRTVVRVFEDNEVGAVVSFFP